MNDPFINCKTTEEVREVFRSEAKRHHPDHGGSEDEFKRLNSFWQAAEQRVRQPGVRVEIDYQKPLEEIFEEWMGTIDSVTFETFVEAVFTRASSSWKRTWERTHTEVDTGTYFKCACCGKFTPNTKKKGVVVPDEVLEVRHLFDPNNPLFKSLKTKLVHVCHTCFRWIITDPKVMDYYAWHGKFPKEMMVEPRFKDGPIGP